MWERASQAAVDAIRAEGDRKVILVAGYEWSGVQQWDRWNPRPWIRDPAGRVRYEAHHYWDPDHSGTYAQGYDAAVADAAVVVKEVLWPKGKNDLVGATIQVANLTTATLPGPRSICESR